MAPRLWNYTPSGGVAPNPDYLLSVEQTSQSPETFKLTLNPKARWTDGTPIDWTAFDATWKTQNGSDVRYNPASTDGYRSIGSVAKGEKDNEVIVTFKEPFYPFEFLFAEIQHPKNLDPDFYKTGWINNLNPELLAGPFTLEALNADSLTLVRNPKWWGDTAKLERVVFRKMESQASINAFQNGEIDSTNVAFGDRLRQVSGMKDVQIRRGYETRTVVYILGRDSELFKDDAARKAFVLGTDRQLLATIQFQTVDWKEEPPGSAVMFPWQDGYRDNIADLHYDPKQAAAVLDAAGWTVGDDGYRHKNGVLAEFGYVDFGDDPTAAALARAQQKMAKDIGLKMNIDIRKSADFAPTITRRDFDVITLAWTATDPFGYVNVCQLFCSDSESNFTGLGNAELDVRLRKPGSISDQAKAIEAANEAEAAALHLYGMLPLFNGPRMTASKAGLANSGPAGFLVPAPQDVGWQKGSQP
jgi:peptide/nickel transport system substrate-binding protein